MPHQERPGGFARASAVRCLSDGRYAAELADGWDILGAMNGGYQLSIVARALADETGREPITVTGHFLAPGRPGGVQIATSMVKQGSRFSTADATLEQGGKVLVAALGTFGAFEPGSEVMLQQAEPPDLPGIDDCVRLAHDPAVRMPPAFMDRIDLRLHPEDAGFASGRPTGRAHMRGWFQLLGGESIGPLAVIVAADCLPPTTFNAGLPIAWTPTLELTVHVRAEPAPGPLRLDFATRFVSHGRLEVDGLIWDQRDRMVAQSRQIALVPRPPA